MSDKFRSDTIRVFVNSTKADSIFFVPGAHGGNYSMDDLLFRQAELALACGDLEKALGLFRAYIKRTKDLPGNRVQLFTAASLAGEFGLAFGVLEELDAVELSTPQRLDIANPWYRVHDRELFAALLTALERYRPKPRDFNRIAYLFMLRSLNGVDDAAALKHLMGCFLGEGKSSFRRRRWLYFKIAETAMHHCHFAPAGKIFSRILREEPDIEDAAGRLAEALLCAGKKSAAFTTLKKAAKYNRISIEVWEGELLLWTGRYREAEKKLRAGTLAGHQLAWCWLGAALFKLGKTKEAVSMLEKALRVRPEDNEARLWLSEVLFSAGKVKKAEEHLRMALRINPNDFWAWLSLAALSLPEDEIREALRTRLPLEVVSALAVKAGLPAKDEYSGSEMRKVLCKARELAKGVRRGEDYLRELWLRRS